jgi:hypothetical protein
MRASASARAEPVDGAAPRRMRCWARGSRRTLSAPFLSNYFSRAPTLCNDCLRSQTSRRIRFGGFIDKSYFKRVISLYVAMSSYFIDKEMWKSLDWREFYKTVKNVKEGQLDFKNSRWNRRFGMRPI